MTSTAEAAMADGDVKIVRTTSTFDCGGRCPIKLHVRNNRILRIEGDDIEDSDQQLRTFLEARRQSLIESPGQIKTVDLRYPSGFSVSHYEPETLAKSDH